jgi:AcrR family transcriptional regulator
MSTRIRLSPEDRRAQLIALGVELISTRSLDEVSIDLLAEEAGVSRGLLYHYFGGKQEFLLAVLQHMADELFLATAPVDHPDLVHRLRVSLVNYLAFVREHHTAYLSFMQTARGGGSPEVRAIYEEGRAALTDRIFDSATADELATFGITDTPTSRLFARGWSAMVEDVLMSWLDDACGLTEDELIDSLTFSLGGVLGSVAARP